MGQVTIMGNELNQIIQQNSALIMNDAGVNYAVTAAAVVVGLLVCFFGLKLIKVLGALIGFLLGASLGAIGGLMAGLTGLALVGVILGAGIVLGILSWFLYRIGIFLLVFVETMGLGIILGGTETPAVAVAAAVVGLILAILAVRFIEPVVIIVTGLAGGFSAGMNVIDLTGIELPPWAGLAAGIVIAVIGIMVQFMMHSRKVGKKEKVYSKKIKEQDSMESEVEKARRLLDDDDDDDDDGDDDGDDDIRFLDEEL